MFLPFGRCCCVPTVVIAISSIRLSSGMNRGMFLRYGALHCLPELIRSRPNPEKGCWRAAVGVFRGSIPPLVMGCPSREILAISESLIPMSATWLAKWLTMVSRITFRFKFCINTCRTSRRWIPRAAHSFSFFRYGVGRIWSSIIRMQTWGESRRNLSWSLECGAR
ncbi:uncharacterized protein LOC109414134 isoform X2 [Aedes albopictus]|uniref:Secreted protein n=1 Tax=Aedes albopictus TaxID=7160 RepID=A0ABM2A5Z4_AEDAL